MNEILIYGDIGFEVQAKDIVSQLNDADGPVTVRVDSFGGDVYAGISILNALRRYPDVVTVYVDGIAASAASFIAVGGADRLIMSPNSSLLIHGAWSQGMGNSEEMAQLAADLNQITDSLATIYAEKTGEEPAYWRELMKKDTTFTAEQAVDAGLADAVDELEKSVRAEKRHAVMAAQRSRFAESGGGRGVPEIETRAAPTPNVHNAVESPPSTSKGEPMSFLQKIADAVGMSPDEVRDELSGFFNESVEVEAKVEIEYPDSVLVSLTDKAVIEPVGVFPEGVEPSVESGDGVAAEVDANGIVTVVAGEDVKPGDSVDVVVTVGDSSAAITVEIVAAADPNEDAASTPPAPAPSDSVTLDRETYEDLRAAAQHGWQAKQESEERALVAEVDRWVAEGRISAALRSKAVAAMKRDAEIARDLYGSNPKGTIPRAEIGHGHDAKADAEENAVSMSDLDNLSAGRRQNRIKR